MTVTSLSVPCMVDSEVSRPPTTPHGSKRRALTQPLGQLPDGRTLEVTAFPFRNLDQRKGRPLENKEWERSKVKRPNSGVRDADQTQQVEEALEGGHSAQHEKAVPETKHPTVRLGLSHENRKPSKRVWFGFPLNTYQKGVPPTVVVAKFKGLSYTLELGDIWGIRLGIWGVVQG